MSECSTLGCRATAVALSAITKNKYCPKCAIKAYALNGHGSVKTLPDMLYPWDMEPDTKCPHCGMLFSSTAIAYTGECPRCRKDLPEFKGGQKVGLPEEWLKADVKYEEGQHD